MGFITNIFNRQLTEAEIERYKRIAKSNADRFGEVVQNARAQLESYRNSAFKQIPYDATYTTLSWRETTSTQGGSSSGGDLGTTINSPQRKLVFHISQDIQHEFPSKVTQYPVELESDIADHIVVQNERFSLRAIFSDASLEIMSRLGVKDIKDQRESFTILLALRNNKTELTLDTPRGRFYDLVISNISAPVSIDGGRSVSVDVQFERIRKVEFEFQPLPQKPKGTQIQKVCAPKVDEGAKPPSTQGSFLYTPELEAQIDQLWKETIYGTGN